MTVAELIKELASYSGDLRIKIDVAGKSNWLREVDYEYDGETDWIILNDYHPHTYRSNKAGLDT